MSDLQSPERLRDHAIASLVPFFVDSTASDVKAARMAAGAILADYNAATPKELQLATQIIALGWASLACLRAAVAAKNLSIEEALALQDNAIALDRASHKISKMLETRRKERIKNQYAMPLQNTRWDEGIFQLAINQALEKMIDANTKLAAYMATLVPPVVEKPKLRFQFGEQMTPSVLARRARP